MADRKGGWRRACCRCETLRTGPPAIGVGDAAVAMVEMRAGGQAGVEKRKIDIGKQIHSRLLVN